VSEEEKFEVINITVKAPVDGESWFDRIMDFITADCQGGDEGGCTCGLETMGGMTGTLEQCYEHERLTENWAFDVQAEDLKIALAFTDDEFKDTVQYERLRKAAYWHDDFNEWLANIPEEEEEETHLEHYTYCNCLADSATCCREICSTCKGEEDE
jgi:hypothetical protein